MKQQVIIVAGGKGMRMQNLTPKQFLLLKGKPILMHTIEAFYNYNPDIDIFIVLPENHIYYWKKLCNEYHFTYNVTIIKGGTERFYSVQNALKLTDKNALIAIHDGVRPLIDTDTIDRCFKAAQEYGNAIPTIALNDSIREINNQSSKAVDRNKFRSVQTPQVFKSDIIQTAYRAPYKAEFTDDASVVESQGIKIHLIEGQKDNIKITSPIDLQIAEAIIS